MFLTGSTEQGKAQPTKHRGGEVAGDEEAKEKGDDESDKKDDAKEHQKAGGLPDIGMALPLLGTSSLSSL